MLSIENLLVGYNSTGHANYLVPFNFNSVQEYLDNTNMTISRTWGTDLEMIHFCHNIMFNVNLYSFDAGSNTWAVFSPVNIEAGLPHVYNIMSVYLYLRDQHFYVVASVRRV